MWKKNIDIRKRILKSMGYDEDIKKTWKNKKSALAEFDRLCAMDSSKEKLKDIPIPTRYFWIWKHFLNIWYQCEYDISGNVIFTYRTVNDYVECMKVPLTVLDKKCLFKMKEWALEIIQEVRDKEK